MSPTPSTPSRLSYMTEVPRNTTLTQTKPLAIVCPHAAGLPRVASHYIKVTGNSFSPLHRTSAQHHGPQGRDQHTTCSHPFRKSYFTTTDGALGILSLRPDDLTQLRDTPRCILGSQKGKWKENFTNHLSTQEISGISFEHQTILLVFGTPPGVCWGTKEFNCIYSFGISQ